MAGELRDAIELTASASGLSGITVKKYPPPGTIEGLNQASLSILASDRATGHAVGADLAILDEAGLLQENNRDLWNAVLSSTSGRDGRMLSISIQGDGPMFSELKARLDNGSAPPTRGRTSKPPLPGCWRADRNDTAARTSLRMGREAKDRVPAGRPEESSRWSGADAAFGF